ncbi:glutamate cysteine ligase [Aspergillus ambiguus]|uniref:glutamate--cysteine ligase n=1 Tax=Aspergillus ambiguus TaxID=176160 RepID=UPI003CCD9A60
MLPIQHRFLMRLLNLWRREKKRQDFDALWGDEVEYTLISLDPDTGRATVLLDQPRILGEWESQIGYENKMQSPGNLPILHPEWASYMIESTPAKPYSERPADLLAVEKDMKRLSRRELIKQHLHPNEHVMTISIFSHLGITAPFTSPSFQPARIPVFRDVKTPWPFQDPACPQSTGPNEFGNPSSNTRENCIYLDGVGFGAGSCCLQTTFQAGSEHEARRLYDQLIPFGPIMLALTAATPIYKGYLADTDVRWNCISSCLDDRMPNDPPELRARFSSNVTYVSKDEQYTNCYMDSQLPISPGSKQHLLEGGMDDVLASHFSHILSRDPIYLTRKDIENLDSEGTNVFESFQGGVWQHVRLKPPPSPSDDIGWRVEFRPMEVQLRDDENAAFAVFMFLLSRAITIFHLDFRIPVTKVTESMELAHNRNAVIGERFWFRNLNWSPRALTSAKETRAGQPHQNLPKEPPGVEHTPTVVSMTVDEIVNGTTLESPAELSHFPGLISIIEAYLDYSGVSLEERRQLQHYLDFVSKRANGKVPTTASWIRSFVTVHEDYRGNSAVSQRVCYDLMQNIAALNDP